MLDRRFNLKQAVKETLDSQFEKMLLSCVFVPLLHREVSLSSVIPKADDEEENVQTSIEDVELAITIRQKLVREDEKRRRSQGQAEADHMQILKAIEESHQQKINRFEYIPRRQSQESMLRQQRSDSKQSRLSQLKPLEKATGVSSISIGPTSRDHIANIKPDGVESLQALPDALSHEPPQSIIKTERLQGTTD